MFGCIIVKISFLQQNQVYINMKASATSKGFSVIELMVVLAIIALLAVVAIPSIREHANKSKMTEVNTLIGHQLDVWTEKNALGLNNTIVQDNPSDYISSISLAFGNDAAVTAVLNNTNLSFLPGPINIIYTPTVTNNVATWSCHYTGTTNLSTYFSGTICTCRDCKSN